MTSGILVYLTLGSQYPATYTGHPADSKRSSRVVSVISRELKYDTVIFSGKGHRLPI